MVKLRCSTQPLPEPNLENAVQVWNPHLSKDIKKLESVQKFALRMCLKRWDSSYDDLLDASKLTRLSTRRKFLCLLYFYKAVNGLIITPDNLIAARHCNYYTRSSCHATYYQPLAHSNMYHNSFFPSTILLWNSLSHTVTTSSSTFIM